MHSAINYTCSAYLILLHDIVSLAFRESVNNNMAANQPDRNCGDSVES